MEENLSKKYIKYLDSLRALAAIYVVIHHGVLQFYLDFVGETGLKRWIIRVFLDGNLAVDLFIVLSGYCLMLPVIKNDYYLKRGSLDFFKRRAKRILPTYYFSILVSLILIWTLIGTKNGRHWDVSIPVNKYDIIAHLFMVHDIFKSTTTKINHAFWSISVESRIYLLFPLLLMSWRKFGPPVTILLTSFIALLCYQFFELPFMSKFNVTSGATGVSPYIILFSCGMLAADISTSTKTKLKAANNLPWGFISLLTILLLRGAIVLEQKHLISIHIVDIAFGIFSSSFLVYLAKLYYNGNETNWVLKFLSWHPLATLGTFAYSIYLIHAPFLEILNRYVLIYFHLSKFMQMIAMITGGTTLIIGISYVFYYLCERPFLSSKKTPSQITVS